MKIKHTKQQSVNFKSDPTRDRATKTTQPVKKIAQLVTETTQPVTKSFAKRLFSPEGKHNYTIGELNPTIRKKIKKIFNRFHTHHR